MLTRSRLYRSFQWSRNTRSKRPSSVGMTFDEDPWMKVTRSDSPATSTLRREHATAISSTSTDVTLASAPKVVASMIEE